MKFPSMFGPGRFCRWARSSSIPVSFPAVRLNCKSIPVKMPPSPSLKTTVITTDYLKGQVRRTTFTWQDKARRLSWQSEGPYAGPDVFQNLHVVLFDPREKIEARCVLSTNGSSCCGNDVAALRKSAANPDAGMRFSAEMPRSRIFHTRFALAAGRRIFHAQPDV